MDTLDHPTTRGFHMAKRLLAEANELDISSYILAREYVRAADKLLNGMPLDDVREECLEEMNDLYADMQTGTPYGDVASVINAKGQTLYHLNRTFMQLAQ